ncbi:MAG: YeeE/YedE family protein, partial [Desulfobulbia bacterium]
VFRTNFCTMGSLSDILSFGDYRRFRSWILAGTIALVGTQLLYYWEVLQLEQSIYLSPNFNWFGNIFGGLLFGFGMSYAGGCATRNLVRVGGGDLRSLFVLAIIGMFAYITIGGIIGPIRAEIQQATLIGLADSDIETQGIDVVLSSILGFEKSIATLLITIGLTGLTLFYCFKDPQFRSSPNHILAGVVVGICVVIGWALTGLAYDELADRPQIPTSLTMVRPTGDTFEYFRRFTADMIPNFGVVTVLGTLVGSFIASKQMGTFNLTTFADTGDTLRNMFGASLMGIGGVFALGCTIGQGITGISTLAIGSFLAMISIIAGGVAGIKYMESRI